MISASTASKLSKVLEDAAAVLPGTFFVVTDKDKSLFSDQKGRLDPLLPAGPDNEVSQDNVLWLASTTKILTSIAILQLIEAGKLTLDSPVHTWLPELTPPLQVLDSISADGTPVFHTTDTPILIKQMLNQTSGFGQEFGPEVSGWKKWTKVGAGFVNSCKEENLVHTPITKEPGTRYQYGNSAEWLGVLIARLTGAPLEDYFQARIFAPLGIKTSTFYPYKTAELKAKVMPTRWFDEDKEEYQELVHQFPGLTLPRETVDIESPVAGGGIYSSPHDYALVLQSLLNPTTSPLLSAASIESLFRPTLPTPESRADLAAMLAERMVPGQNLKAGDVDWSTGMCLWLRRRVDAQGKEWGRSVESAGWSGAANTQVFIDRKYGITCVFSTNVLRPGLPFANKIKDELERILYEGLEEAEAAAAAA